MTTTVPQGKFDWGRMKRRALTADEELAAREEAMGNYWTKATLASAAALDRLEARMIDFGTITMSAPLLSQPGNAFEFDLEKTADDYFGFARSDVQGIFQNREAIVNSTQIRGSVVQDEVVGAQVERQERADQSKEIGNIRNQQMRDQVLAFRQEAIEKEYDADMAKAELETDPDAKSRAKSAALTKKATSTEALIKDDQATTAPGVLPEKEAMTDLNATPRATLDALNATSPIAAMAQITPTMSSRSAIIAAAGDNAVESIFKLLGNPEKYVNYQDKVLLFGVVAVSVTPGKETKQDYAADISVSLQYEWTRAKASTISRLAKVPENAEDAAALIKLAKKEARLRTPEEDKEMRDYSASAAAPPPPQGLNPLVVAVSPLMEQQIIDQTSSYRKQTEFALQLSALLSQAGLKTQADAVTQHLKREEADARTRDPIGLINTYSLAGGTFGFRISPRLQALTDASSRKAKSGHVLSPQSFPALVIIAIDAEDYQPKVRRSSKDGSISAVWEPSFKFMQTSR